MSARLPGSWLNARLVVALAIGMAAGCGEDHDTQERPFELRVLSYNIHHGEGVDGHLDLGRIAALIRAVAPDVVALQEVDRHAWRTLMVDQAAILGEATGLRPVFGEFMPFEGGSYGMALLSRWEILSERNLRLPDGIEPRSSVVLEVRPPGGGRLVIAGVHFYASESERLAQAEALAAALDAESAPVLMAGDFNSERGSLVMERLSPRWQVLEKTAGTSPLTFPSPEPDREIDFIVARRDVPIEVVRHVVLEEVVASDHRPILADLTVGPPSR